MLLRCRTSSLHPECYLRNGFPAGCFGFWCLPCLYGKNASKMRGTSCSGPGCCYACCPCFTCSAHELLFWLLQCSIIAFVSCRACTQSADGSLGTHWKLAPCLCAVFAGTLRAEVRTKYNLPPEPCADCCVHLCCSPLAVCQEAREIKVWNIACVCRQWCYPWPQTCVTRYDWHTASGLGSCRSIHFFRSTIDSSNEAKHGMRLTAIASP